MMDLPVVVAIVTGLLVVFGYFVCANSDRIAFWYGSTMLRLVAMMMKKTIFVIDYKGGYNLNFGCTYEELRKIVPDHLDPVPVTILENEKEPRYLFSMYCADLLLEGLPEAISHGIGRTDAFTYVRNKEDGKLGLCFVSAFCQYPRGRFIQWWLRFMNHFFGMDPCDFSLGYPHLDAKEINISDDGFLMRVGGTCIRVSGKEKNVASKNNLFSRQFICANSQIYRGSNGAKNTNFFNQDFVDAKVTSWDHKSATEFSGDAAKDIHPLCRKDRLVSVQHYNAAGQEPIRWYFENN